MKPYNIKGKKFGRLVVIEYDLKSKGTGHAHWLCLCDCGNTKVIRASKLKDGGTKSCGCYAREISSKLLTKYANSDKHKGKGNPAFKHGETNNKLFKIYLGILGRCNSKSSGNYNNYGGRGIKCEWKTYLDFKKDMEKSFLEHIKKYGSKNTTIERINVNGNYCKENCRWATKIEQAQNTRSNTFYTYKGQTKNLKQWSKLLKNLSYDAFLHRLEKMSFEEAFETPRLRKPKKL